MTKVLLVLIIIFFHSLCQASSQSLPDELAMLLDDDPLPAANDLRHLSGLRMELIKLYEQRDYQALWLNDEDQPRLSVKSLLARLKKAPGDGLQIDDYPLVELDSLLQSGDPDSLARFELLFSITLMQYVEDLRNGRLSPRDLQLGLPIENSAVNFAALLPAMADSDNPVELLDQQAPRVALYRRLQALLEFWLVEQQQAELPLQLNQTLRPGDAMTVQFQDGLSQRLQWFRLDAPAPTETYNPDWVEAVTQLQAAHGLSADGVIGKATLAALNMGWEVRLGRVVASMERLRWLPHYAPEQRFIIVNVPEFQLRAFDSPEGGADFQSKVIVGKIYDRYRTPIFKEDMKYVVFNPYWNIPTSILRRSILPHADKPGYLSKNGYEIVDRFGPSAQVYEPTEANINKLRKGHALLRQKPGPINALGEAKFIFPNADNVYLHGTPEQSLFQRDKRAYSSGCVRVEDLHGLAAWVFADQGWDREQVQSVLATKKTKQVNLKSTIHVAILYSTAVVKEGGAVFLYDDIYGHDQRLLKSL